MMTNVLIFSRSALIREEIAALLEGSSDITVFGTYRDYRELLDSLDWQMPDVLLIDLYELEDAGVLISQALLTRYAGLKILILSESCDLATALTMFRTGVYAYLHKSHSPLLLQEVVRNIDRQRIFLHAEALFRNWTENTPGQSADFDKLVCHNC